MTTPRDAHRQGDYSVRMDWGVSGASAISPGCDVAIVVDVLSFTTTLTVAVDRGTVVFPYRWRDESAAIFAAEHAATLAVGRSKAGPGEVSLSPGSVRDAAVLDRLVLPSPNGSTISYDLARSGAEVLGVSLRNRDAAARWLSKRRKVVPRFRLAVVAAGERWPDGSLRPSVEDLWGAGALIAALSAAGWASLSPEAHAAADAYSAISDLDTALAACASGRELIGLGYADDVCTAAELDSSNAVPVLSGEAFIAAG